MKKNKIKILVTGSNGLIGREFCNQLKIKKIKFKGTDINYNILNKNFYNFLNIFKPNIIIHCASHPGGLSFNFPIKNIEVNYVGSAKIIDWCAKNNCKFIFMSSSAVYGNREKIKKIKETDPLKPETIYGINKLAVEKLIQNYHKHFKLNWLVFRLFATYGPGHKANDYQGIVNVIISQLKNGNKIMIKGSLKRTRSIIYVKDAVKLMLNILLKNKKNKIINIGSEKYYSIAFLINIIGKIFNKKIKIKKMPGTPGDPLHNNADITYMKTFTNLRSSYDLNKGIQETKNKRNL